MGRKRHTAEEIIGKLRTAEIELARLVHTRLTAHSLPYPPRRTVIDVGLGGVSPEAFEAASNLDLTRSRGHLGGWY